MIIYTPLPTKNSSKENGHAKHDANDNQRIASLEKEVADLRCLLEGLWNLLRANTQLNDADLRTAMAEVVKDRHRKREKKRGCKTCSRLVSARYQKCIYCGGELIGEAEPSLF